MKNVIINAVTALLLMIVQTNVGSSFGMDFVCHYIVIASILSGVASMPMISSTISILILSLVFDCFVSGPIGLYAFASMLVFGITRSLLNRFKSERVIGVMIWGFLMSMAFDVIQSTLYSLYYLNTQYWGVLARVFWLNALATMIVIPMVMWIERGLESLFSRHRKTGLT